MKEVMIPKKLAPLVKAFSVDEYAARERRWAKLIALANEVMTKK